MTSASFPEPSDYLTIVNERSSGDVAPDLQEAPFEDLLLPPGSQDLLPHLQDCLLHLHGGGQRFVQTEKLVSLQ